MLVASCGSHGRPLSKAEYVKKANAVCRALASELTTTDTWKTEQQIAIEPNVTELWEAALKKLRALHAPTRDRATVAKLWDEEEVAYSRWDAELKSGKVIETFEHEPAIFRQVAADTNAYGITECGT
jgi:hypothetical protein